MKEVPRCSAWREAVRHVACLVATWPVLCSCTFIDAEVLSLSSDLPRPVFERAQELQIGQPFVGIHLRTDVELFTVGSPSAVQVWLGSKELPGAMSFAMLLFFHGKPWSQAFRDRGFYNEPEGPYFEYLAVFSASHVSEMLAKTEGDPFVHVVLTSKPWLAGWSQPVPVARARLEELIRQGADK